MAYFDELRPASFRGIDFTAMSTSEGGGRRGAINQYPDLDSADFTDTGGKTKPFTLNISLFEPNVLNNAAALKEALNKIGKGKLVHPINGEMSVITLDWQSENNVGSGDEIRFTCEFLRVSDTPTGVIAIKNPIVSFPDVIEAALTAVSDDFAKTYSLDEQPEFLITAAVDDFNNIALEIQTFLGNTVKLVNDFVTSVEKNIKAPFVLASQVQTLISAGIRVAKFDIDLSKSFPDLFSPSRFRASRAAEQTFSNANKLQSFDLSIDDIPTETEPRKQQIKNAQAIQNLTINMAIIEEASLHLDTEGQTLFISRESALDALKITLTKLNIIKTDQPAINSEIDTLKINLSSASQQLYGQLSGEKEITLPFFKNALVFSYEQTGSFENVGDIISRNNLPTFDLEKDLIIKIENK